MGEGRSLQSPKHKNSQSRWDTGGRRTAIRISRTDLFIFKPEAACIVRVRQTRYRINPDTIYEALLPDDLRDVRTLPFPQWIPREIWLRTQHERAWRRLRVHELSVGELEWWGPDNYTNPHAR